MELLQEHDTQGQLVDMTERTLKGLPKDRLQAILGDAWLALYRHLYPYRVGNAGASAVVAARDVIVSVWRLFRDGGASAAA